MSLYKLVNNLIRLPERIYHRIYGKREDARIQRGEPELIINPRAWSGKDVELEFNQTTGEYEYPERNRG